jgi:hypothetical protein
LVMLKIFLQILELKLNNYLMKNLFSKMKRALCRSTCSHYKSIRKNFLHALIDILLMEIYRRSSKKKHDF